MIDREDIEEVVLAILRREIEAIEPQFDGDDGLRFGSAVNHITDLVLIMAAKETRPRIGGKEE